jgi:DNA-binding GntR family transcriptional regulator
MKANRTIDDQSPAKAEIRAVSDFAKEMDRNGGMDRNCMHDRIRWTILERIMDGTYQPGERLKELPLAREFGVSQAPVREALRKLEAVGVLKSDPYRGTRVRELSPAELRDAYQLRGILEQSATEFISEFSEEAVCFLEREFTAMQAAFVRKDLRALAMHNRNFHRCIVESCRNREILRAWDSLDVCMRSRMNVQRRLEYLPEGIASHQPIIDALRARDFRAAGRLLRHHSFDLVSDLV